ncbi:3-hydroxyacyl-CoA dehydrogenase/enoyl-CoA hydratase family protein [Roseisolibacter sp. H3M3-2]|uniref:3-hydroxyacyl-CoA dehydrogenase/enoyl-CoA hydratase family protein n=1 Tax=Roseisolibacter sp. H3M3-2 TaxID=3031323 RepID=UPI0023D9C3B6|nr:3-hydroxyacyl-CoA dehydrogenase/enoyl-CoA hydratase family protein [Roseisolibacter sp. H3M3-2]MDF1504893.1 3-hydroxyacyl-CoA dehydrogenase/enoyl-CoA hydratase family protein [Roseisolibacter sp. H3M3-2]
MSQETSTAGPSRTAFAGLDLGFDLGETAQAPAARPRIRKVGVVGAGTMGSGIAALAASAGLPVVLLDIPAEGGDRGAIPRGAVQKALKAKPAAFMDGERAALIRTGNTEDDLALLADCDLVIEAIIEQPGPKQALYERLEQVLKPTAIVSSNTSGIPMGVLTQGRSERFRKQFLGTHFFAPPRYMHLLEIIPTPETDPAVVESVRAFGESVLGKGIVICKDAPGFIANRLGVYGMNRTIARMEEYGLTIDEVDGLTGALLGRPKSATFRTGDLSGIDVLVHVTKGLAQATGESFPLPAWFEAMVASKQLGDKTQGGFYKKVGKDIQTWDFRAGQYVPQQRLETPELKAATRAPLAQRIAGLKTLPGKYGDFVRAVLLDTARYAAETSPSLAYDIPSVDRAMEWGYGHDAGPFRVMDMLGVDWVKAELEKRGDAVPALLQQAQGAFYRGDEVLGFDGRYQAVAPIAGNVRLSQVAAQPGRVLAQNEGARLLDLGDGVALLEFRGKSNALGSKVLDLLATSLERIERDGMAGLVIGNDDPKFFSAGADLAESTGAVIAGMWDVIEQAIHRFQQATQSIRYAPFPVVVAPAGMALGGGCEFALHADAVQAHAELYMGLVEAGVGLLPGGGGTKELLFRFTKDLEPYEEADPFEAVKRAFRIIATAQTSTSALEARRIGFLRAHDRVSMNRDRLIADAKRRVLDLAPDYVAPAPRTIRALGKEGMGNLSYALFSFHEAGQATPYDVQIGHEIAYVLCGGDGPPRTVTEQDILDLERESFLKLLGNEKTQERIAYTLKTGKPLRN